MSKVITYQICGVVLDALYHNTQKDPKDQKSMRQVAKDCGVSLATLFAFRDILVDLKIIIKEGNRAGQKIYWHPDKVGLNEQMSRNVYNIYVGDKRKKTIKPKKQVVKSTKIELSIETAILFLVENGFTGQLTRHPNPYTTEIVDLAKL